MRIAFYNDRYALGGGERVTCDMTRGLLALRPDIEVYLVTSHYEEHGLSGGAKLVEFNPTISMRKAAGVSELAALLKSLGVDVLIIPVTPKKGMLPVLKQAFPELKLIVQYHSMPMWQVFNKTSRRPIGWLRERLFCSYSRRYLARIKEECHWADAVTTLCQAYSNQIAAMLDSFADRKKIHTMHNPVNRVIARSARRKEVLYVGRLSYPDKRVDRLMRIWARVADRFPDWCLRIVGEGEEEVRMKRQARKLGLTNLEFCGSTQDPAQYYATASILLLTSDYEGWPLVLAEALSAGILPIAMNVSPGVAEILADGRGVLVPPGDEEAFATALAEAMQSRRRPADASEFLSALSSHEVSRRWLTLIDKILK